MDFGGVNFKKGKKIMPTGFTAGILDGTITTFEEYAKPLARQFGALMHMRDEPNNAPYKLMKADTEYYQSRLREAKDKLIRIISKTEQEFLEEEIENFKELRAKYHDIIEKKKRNKIVLEKYLSVAKEYEPPTSGHNGIKALMIEQLESTIESDCDDSYYQKSLMQIAESEENIDPVRLKSEKIQHVEKEIRRIESSIKGEKETTQKCNLWAKQYFQSIKLELPKD